MNAAQKIHSAKTRGFALMMAIFIIITLAAIAVYLLTISTGQIEAAVQDEQGARAYQAARTGLDWGAYQLLCNTSNPQCNRPDSTFFTNCNGGAASQTLSLGNLGANFSSTVECTKVATETEGAVTVNVYRLQATGCNNPACPLASPGPTYVERQLQLTLTR
jgi:MSHA biogenesis protein MshP